MSDVNDHDHDRRLTDHESKIASLITSVDSLVSSFKADREQRSMIDEAHREEMRLLSKSLNDTSKFPISSALTSLGLAIMLIGGFYALLSQNDSRIEAASMEIDLRMENRSEGADHDISERVDAGWAKLIEHTSDGHPAVQSSQIEAIVEDFKRIEKVSVTSAELGSELKSIYNIIKRLEQDDEKSRKWIDRHDQVVPVLNATQNTKDDNFDKQLKRIERSISEHRKISDARVDELHKIIGSLYRDLAKK